MSSLKNGAHAARTGTYANAVRYHESIAHLRQARRGKGGHRAGLVEDAARCAAGSAHVRHA